MLDKYMVVWRVLRKAVHSLTRPRSSGDRAVASGAMSAGSNPAEGAKNNRFSNIALVRVPTI